MAGEDFMQELSRLVRAKVDARVEEEVLRPAKERLERIVKEEVASMAISLAKYADVRSMADRLIIEVRFSA